MTDVNFHDLLPVQATGEVDRLLLIAAKKGQPFKVRLITGHGITRDIVQGYLLMNNLYWKYDGPNEGAMIVIFNEED